MSRSPNSPAQIPPVLCGDIGGTHTRLALLAWQDERPQIRRERTFASTAYADLGEILSAFLAESGPVAPSAAAFGLAGPVRNGRCQITNLPWRVDADQLARRVGFPVWLLNDLEAAAWGLPALSTGQLLTLQPGTADPVGNRTLIAAGTGLGEAGLVWDGDRYLPFATEGGHCDFAPTDELQTELRNFLQKRLAHATWEDVVSGPGLSNLFCFLLEYNGTPPPSWFSSSLEGGDPAAAISRAAETGDDPLARTALELFVRFYAAEAGNLALKHMATGGVFLAGGIAPKILTWLQQPAFLETFCNKGLMRDLLESVPVQVILDDRVALYGAALFLRDRSRRSAP
jgi:glucokinase